MSLIALLVLASQATAVSIPVLNGGFESPALADGTNLVALGAPWVLAAGPSNPPVTENPAGPGVGVVEGEQRMRIRSLGSASTFIIQTLAETYQPDTTYTLSVVPIDFTADSVPQFQITLEGVGFHRVNFGDLPGVLGQPVVFTSTVMPGDPIIGTNIAVSVALLPQSSSNATISFDDVRLTAVAVPEPSTASLLKLGLVGLGVRRYLRPATRLADCSAGAVPRLAALVGWLHFVRAS